MGCGGQHGGDVDVALAGGLLHLEGLRELRRHDERGLGARQHLGDRVGDLAVLHVQEPHAVTELLQEGGRVHAAHGRPERVELEHDVRVQALDEQLVDRASVDLVRELPLVVVVPEGEPARGGLHLQLVDPVGDAVRVVGGLPALGGDEGVDDRLDPELRGGVEGAGGLVVVAVDDGRVAGGRGDAGRGERGGELVGALDERVRLDLRVADLGDAGDGALQVRGDSVADRVELDGGGGHGRSFQEVTGGPTATARSRRRVRRLSHDARRVFRRETRRDVKPTGGRGPDPRGAGGGSWSVSDAGARRSTPDDQHVVAVVTARAGHASAPYCLFQVPQRLELNE